LAGPFFVRLTALSHLPIAAIPRLGIAAAAEAS
jgi:hypothetical protein